MTLALTKERFEAGPPRPIKAIVLDDDHFDRKRLVRWAKSPLAGTLEFAEAADLNQFAHLVSKQRFDVVFLDFCLADGNGVDALECLLASSRNASAYVVMISGQEDALARRAALERGCDEYVPKSVLDETQFGRILRDASRGADPERELDPRISAVDYWATRARRRKLPHVGTDKPLEGTGRSRGGFFDRGLVDEAFADQFLDDFMEIDEFVFNFSTKT